MNGESNKDWLKEYETFLKAEETIPRQVSESASRRMEPLLNPNATTVFGKLLAIHSVVGFLSLAFCHQFELNPFRTAHSLDNWFMSLVGHNVCMVICGIVFLGFSVLAAGYFLSLEETRALRRTGFPQIFALGALSLGLFATVGAELALAIASLWLLGALIGGFVATETIWRLKYIRIQRLQRI